MRTHLIAIAVFLATTGTSRAEPLPTDGASVLLTAGAGVSRHEVLPDVLALVAYRSGQLSLEAGLSTVFVRVDAAVGVRIFPLPTSGVYVAGCVTKSLFTTAEHVRTGPIAMARVGYELGLGPSWSISGDVGALGVVADDGGGYAFTAMVGIRRRL
jgi:hypothetical protein